MGGGLFTCEAAKCLIKHVDLNIASPECFTFPITIM